MTRKTARAPDRGAAFQGKVLRVPKFVYEDLTRRYAKLDGQIHWLEWFAALDAKFDEEAWIVPNERELKAFLEHRIRQEYPWIVEEVARCEQKVFGVDPTRRRAVTNLRR